MPATRRSLSVPPRWQTSSFASTFDDPAFFSSQPATPVYGRHTGLEGYVPEGFLHTPEETKIGRKSVTKELIRQLEPLSMSNGGKNGTSQPCVVLTATSHSHSRPPLHATTSFPQITLDSKQSSSPPPAPAPLADSEDFPSSPPSPTVGLVPHFDMYDPNPTNPKALPLPSPPLDGEYIFPDPTGRASLLPPLPPNSKQRLKPRVHSFEPSCLPSSPPFRPLLSPPRSNSPIHHNLQPSAPNLEPMRYLAPSPPSGRLSAFTGSPQPVSPNFELEGPLLENWCQAPPPPSITLGTALAGGLRLGRGGAGGLVGGGRKGARGRGRSSRQSPSPSPLRGGGGNRIRDHELEKANERIQELELEVNNLRKELVESKIRDNFIPRME